MIKAGQNSKKQAAITSDQWHVVHSHWTTATAGKPCFVRTIVSEHANRGDAVLASRAVLVSLGAKATKGPLAKRDQVFVRKPGFKSLKATRTVVEI